MSSLQKFHRRTQPFKVNTLHTGTATISGTVAVGQTLTASHNFADADGLGTMTYQWNRSGTAISGATSSTYLVSSDDIGNTLSVTITYIDGSGFIETGISASTITVPLFATVGSGTSSVGFWLCNNANGTLKVIVAPKSTESTQTWGSAGILRGANAQTTSAITNTNTLYSYGAAAHPAAAYCKTLTTGGYSWYLPSWNDSYYMFQSRTLTPFATNDGFTSGANYWTSNEDTANNAMSINNGSPGYNSKSNSYLVRAVRYV